MRWFLVNKSKIINFFYIFYWFHLLMWVMGALLLTSFYSDWLIIIYDLGRRLGYVALLFYILTLIPGILKRLRVWESLTQPIVVVLMSIRRQLGVHMFLLAYGHQLFVNLYPVIFSPALSLSDIQIKPHVAAGFLALMLLFPLWLTSNDLSVRYLGLWWKKIHMLTYLAMFLIFAHLALLNSNWAILMSIVVILQLVSWLRLAFSSSN